MTCRCKALRIVDYATFIINEAVFQTEANNTVYTARFGQAMLDHDTLGSWPKS